MNKVIKRQKGFSFIEVMIALAVLSIGLTGIAVMQMTTLKYVHSAHYRSMASTIALDFEERLWWKIADDGLSGCPDLDDSDGSAIDDLLTHWSRDYVGGEQDDDWNWSSARMLKLPGLQITAGTAVANDYVSEVPITLTWTEGRFNDVQEGSTESFTYNVRIMCRPVVATEAEA